MLNPNGKFIAFLRHKIQHYNPAKYWKRRQAVANPKTRIPNIILLLWFLYVKKCDAFNGASMGTNFRGGAIFHGVPNLPHGLNGIFVGYSVEIGKNVIICQQVTISTGGKNGVTRIGDNCLLGKGCIVMPGVQIGNNVRIGANAVVTDDVPDNCTVVGIKARIIKKDGRRIGE